MPLELIEPQPTLYGANLLNEHDDLVCHTMACLGCLLVIALDDFEKPVEATGVLCVPTLGCCSNLIELPLDARVALDADLLVLFAR
jgi:hypothetical protein